MKIFSYIILGSIMVVGFYVSVNARMIHSIPASQLSGSFSVAGFDESLILTNAELNFYPRPRWGVGTSLWLWQRYQEQQVLAMDIQIQRRFGRPRFGLWIVGLGIGLSGSTVANQPLDTAISGNLSLDYKLRLTRGLQLFAKSTWMIFRDGFTAPVSAGLEFFFSPRLSSGIGFMGIHTFSTNHEPTHTFESRPSLGINFTF